MPKLTGIMDIGKRSLSNAQLGLQTTSHNIANKDVEGYARQRVELQTSTPVGIGHIQIGTGAKVAAIRNIKNDYLEKQIQGEFEKKGLAEGRQDSIYRVEQVFNEQLNKGLNQLVGDFFNAFRELANAPESQASRTLVQETADAVSKDFNRINRALKDIQNDIDAQMKTEIAAVNSMAKQIAGLNQKIAQVEIQGRNANDERDQRDQILKELGEKVDIKYSTGDNGMINVIAGNMANLVSGITSSEIYVQDEPGQIGHRYGAAQIYLKPSDTTSPVNVTSQFDGGRIGGILEVRDGLIEQMLDDMDTLAYNLATEVNKQHIDGRDRYGGPAVLFFNFMEDKFDAAGSIKVNDTINNDPGRMVAGYSPNGPGDNRIANNIIKLQSEKLLNNSTSTFDDFYNSMVGTVAVQMQKAEKEAHHQNGIITQLQNIRESISGVSLDEETAKMIELQKGFDASARIIRTAEEMFDTVINLKRY